MSRVSEKQCAQVVRVVVHGLQVAGFLGRGLGAEPLVLILRVVELGERVGELHAGDEQLEALGDAWIVGPLLGQRAK